MPEGHKKPRLEVSPRSGLYLLVLLKAAMQEVEVSPRSGLYLLVLLKAAML